MNDEVGITTSPPMRSTGFPPRVWQSAAVEPPSLELELVIDSLESNTLHAGTMTVGPNDLELVSVESVYVASLLRVVVVCPHMLSLRRRVRIRSETDHSLLTEVLELESSCVNLLLVVSSIVNVGGFEHQVGARPRSTNSCKDCGSPSCWDEPESMKRANCG